MKKFLEMLFSNREKLEKKIEDNAVLISPSMIGDSDARIAISSGSDFFEKISPIVFEAEQGVLAHLLANSKTATLYDAFIMGKGLYPNAHKNIAAVMEKKNSTRKVKN